MSCLVSLVYIYIYMCVGLKPLPVVYKDLVEMTVDHSKYKQWSAKPLPANCKTTADILFICLMTFLIF